jgi:hypothetical protein
MSHLLKNAKVLCGRIRKGRERRTVRKGYGPAENSWNCLVSLDADTLLPIFYTAPGRCDETL